MWDQERNLTKRERKARAAEVCPCAQNLEVGETVRMSKDRKSILPFYLQFLEELTLNIDGSVHAEQKLN